jgi:hypothetical protein
MIWVTLDSSVDLGFLPDIITDEDPRPVKDQVNDKYDYGGGWRPLPGFNWNGRMLTYPGDPPMEPIAVARLRDELLFFYPGDWLLVAQKDGSFECSRMD